MRTGRSNTGTVYTYTYNGSQLSRMTYGSTTMRFTYSADGSPLAINYNGSTYYYVTNLQGDVVQILDSAGVQVVYYTYDAWGRLLSTDGTKKFSLGMDNPLRYRGYVYDRETGLYYLQSRYYNPTWGRFINADGLLGAGESIVGYNMFAYCDNNPVMGYDPLGCFDLGGFLTGVAIVAVGAAVIGLTVVTAGAATPLAAVAITSVGTAIGVAAIETGASITAAAATDSTAVLDFSYSNGATSTKYGYSAVIDFGNDTAEFYSHVGTMTSSSYGCAYGTGLVFNYNDLGDYGGSFVDFSGSINYRGADYGIDVCLAGF